MHYGQRQHRTHQQTIIKTYYIHFKTATILLSHSTLNYIVPNDYHHSLRATTLTLSYQCNQCCRFMLSEATFRLFLFVQHCKTSLQLVGLREHKVFSVTMSFKTFFLALLSNKVKWQCNEIIGNTSCNPAFNTIVLLLNCIINNYLVPAIQCICEIITF